MADASSLASPYKHPRSKLMHLIQYQSSHNPSTLLAHHITISRSAIRSIYTRLSTRSDIEMQRVHRVSHSTAHCIIACMYWNEMQSNLCLRHSYHIIGKPTPEEDYWCEVYGCMVFVYNSSNLLLALSHHHRSEVSTQLHQDPGDMFGRRFGLVSRCLCVWWRVWRNVNVLLSSKVSV